MLACALCLLACADDTQTPASAAMSTPARPKVPDTPPAQPSLAEGSARPQLPDTPAHPALCDREGDDPVRDLFCGAAPAHIGSLVDLQTGLQLGNGSEGVASAGMPGLNQGGMRPTFAAALAHSTSLSGDLVSPINPRIFIFDFSSVLAFTRGLQQVEIASYDRKAMRANFYLVSFNQPCNAADGGCKPRDLFTPQLESEWTKVAVHDDEELKNTPSDCRQCHQRGIEKPLLLMRELDHPWTHFFASEKDSVSGAPEPDGSDLADDYAAAKGGESYAGLPVELLHETGGLTFERAVDSDQPIIFDSMAIMNERWPQSSTGYAAEAQASKTWYDAYAAFKRGDQLALPYYAPRVTDPAKQAQLTAAYRSFVDGKLAAADLPDLADIFPDDPQTRAEIGLQTEPGASPAELLVQACASCHNDVLDQTISRARFSVAIGRLGRNELELAIERLKAPRTSAGAMPPQGRRQPDEDARARLGDYLEQNQRSSADDELLEHAARAGMASPVQR